VTSEGSQPGDGLRARKRAATEATIQRAALSLALERGYEKVTVEMICEAAMVSPRTFFNYFGSKEGVVLGVQPPMPTDDEISGFVNASGSDVLGDLVGMITATLAGHEHDADVFRSRRALIQRTPELSSKEMARIGEVEDEFVRIILARFHAQGRTEAATPDLEDEARMVVGLAAGVMHYAMRKWFNGDFAGAPAELLGGSLDLVRRIIRDSASGL
jgi:AcrR family transcriptional regulator